MTTLNFELGEKKSSRRSMLVASALMSAGLGASGSAMGAKVKAATKDEAARTAIATEHELRTVQTLLEQGRTQHHRANVVVRPHLAEEVQAREPRQHEIGHDEVDGIAWLEARRCL